MKRKPIQTHPSCTKTGPMCNLPYGAYMARAAKRKDKQSYCATCLLCVWPEEQRSCKAFVPSPELDRFYEEEARR